MLPGGLTEAEETFPGSMFVGQRGWLCESGTRKSKVGNTWALTAYAPSPSARQTEFGLENSVFCRASQRCSAQIQAFMSWWVYSPGEEEMLFVMFANFHSLGFHFLGKPRIGK